MPESAANVVVHGPRTLRPTHRTGFTLIDVLVTMGVIAVLISLLAPSLSSVRESARQVVCRSNVLQMGIGISMYARDNYDLIPPSVNASGGNGDPWQTMSLRLTVATPGQPEGWDGLGRLYADDVLPTPRLFYCPSHRGDHPFIGQAGLWSGEPGEIVGNFQYRGAGLSKVPTRQNPQPTLTTRFESMWPGSALIADGMRTQADFNHQIGANVLRASLAVEWFPDQGGNFRDMLPRGDGTPLGVQAALAAWQQLDDSHR